VNTAMIENSIPSCPWCARAFPNWSLAKRHVKFCSRAPRPRAARGLEQSAKSAAVIVSEIPARPMGVRPMKLTREQSQKLLRERAIWITNACDKCGQLLGAVRWTRRGEAGEWCSAECRDGIKTERSTSASVKLAASAQPQRRIGSRTTGRCKTHATNAEKQRSYRPAHK
jgi:hypothetical protein